MILVDTSVWIDHFRHVEPQLVDLLGKSQVLVHAVIIGELACGKIKARAQTLHLLRCLPAATQASDEEALQFLERNALYGRGIGWVDMQLCASAKLTGAKLWSRDKRLKQVANELGFGYVELKH